MFWNCRDFYSYLYDDNSSHINRELANAPRLIGISKSMKHDASAHNQRNHDNTHRYPCMASAISTDEVTKYRLVDSNRYWVFFLPRDDYTKADLYRFGLKFCVSVRLSICQTSAKWQLKQKHYAQYSDSIPYYESQSLVFSQGLWEKFSSTKISAQSADADPFKKRRL